MTRTWGRGLILLLAGCAAVAGGEEGSSRYWGPTWRERLAEASRDPQAWEARRAEIRRQILVSSGLWPEFGRPALQPLVWGRLERDGYSVEKVRLETRPGFFLTGNLYRPLGKAGPHPAVLSMHGHWKNGRFEDIELASIPGRAIGLARLGCVVFSTDMVGYGDSKQLPHAFSNVPWGLNLQGLQLWNSLRAVDFLSALPDVDPSRIGATGASGGGTQTFLLTAVDARIRASAPVNMVAAGCQGGCSCENAPLLRLDLNNIEIAAACAPRPLLLMACATDWTADALTLEGPALQKVFDARGVPERFRVARVEADHNYNKETREIVYAFFARWLLGRPAADRLPEAPFKVEKREDLSAFDAVHPLPAGAVDSKKLEDALKQTVTSQLEELRPKDVASLARFRELMLPAFRHTLGARRPQPGELQITEAGPDLTLEYRGLPGVVRLHRQGPEGVRRVVVVLGENEQVEGSAWVLRLRAHEREVPCNAGVEIRNKGWVQWRENHPLTYYRTELARQVQDVLTALAAAGGPDVILEGRGDAGVAVLLARALVPAGVVGTTIVDLGGRDDRPEESWAGPRALPGILRIGGLRSAAALVAPGNLELKNAGAFDVSVVRAAYRAAGAEAALK